MKLKQFSDPKHQAAHDDAYMKAVQGPAFWDEPAPRVDDPNSEEQVKIHLAWMMGKCAGMEDWALKNGVKTPTLGTGPAGHS